MAKKKTSKKSKTAKTSKRKTTKRTSKKKTTRKAARSQQQVIIIKGEGRVPLKRAAAEQAAGGFGAGFGIAAGHEFGEWLYD